MSQHSGQLLSLAVGLITGYRSGECTLHTHLERSLGAEVGEADRVFLTQVVEGCYRNERPLRVFLNALYHCRAAVVLRTDFTLNQILSYLVFWRLDELGVPALCGLLDSQNASTMHALVSFMVDEDALQEWVVQGWCKFLDRGYVETELLGRLRRHRAGLCAWLERSAVRAFGPGGTASSSSGGSSSSSSGGVGGGGTGEGATRRPPTIPKAPKLTAPRARVPPEPTLIHQVIKANPIPNTLERTTLEDIEAARVAASEEVRRATLGKYGPGGPQAPRLAHTRTNVERVRAEVEAARAAEAGQQFRARPAPTSYPSANATVKLTAAALLREDAVFRKRQEEEAGILREYEATLRDQSGYDAWRAEVVARDEEAEKAHTEHRRREAQAAEVAAARAVALVKRSKEAIADKVRAASSVVEEMVKVELAGEVKLRAAVAEAVKAVEYSAPAAAAAAVAEEKRVEGEARRQEAAAAAEALRLAAERDAREKTELIRQLRAIERTPKPMDPTLAFNRAEVGAPKRDPDAGIWFEAMSLVELRERLASERARVIREREGRHVGILQGKREASEKLGAVAQGVVSRRAARSAAGEARRQETKAAALAAKRAEEGRFERIMVAASESVEARAAAKAEERRILAGEERRAATMTAFMGGVTDAVEVRRLADRGKAIARRSRAEQREAGRLADEEAGVRVGEREESRARRRAEVEAEEEAEAGRRAALKTSKDEEEAARVEDAAWRKASFFYAVDREAALSAALARKDPYTAFMATRAREEVRETKGEPPLAALHSMTLTKRLERLPSTHPLTGKLTATLNTLRPSNVSGGLGGTAHSAFSNSSSFTAQYS